MKRSKNSIRERFDTADAERTDSLETARRCSALIDPTVLPPANRPRNQPLPRRYQSLGGRGMKMVVGSLLGGLYPPGVPWIALTASPTITYNPPDPHEQPEAAARFADGLQRFEGRLQLRAAMAQAVLESSGLTDPRHGAGFRTAQRQAIAQVLITGETLQRLTPDFQIINYRRDRYVTERADDGSVLWHIVREEVDPLASLTDAQLAKAEIKRSDLEGLDPADRRERLDTRTVWQPATKKWLVQQEVCGYVVNEFDEEVSSFVNPYFSLSPGENYASGYAEIVLLGDLTSYEELRLRMVQFAEASSRIHPILDPSSNIKPKHLLQPTGTPFIDRVDGGSASKVAFLMTNKLADFTVVQRSIEQIEATLGASLLINSAQIRDSDRTTATEVERVIQQNDGLFGGLYAPFADRMNIPTMRWTLAQLESKKLATRLSPSSYTIAALTGVEALARVRRARTVLQATQIAQSLGEEASRAIDTRVALDVFMRYNGVYETGLVRTPEQIEQEMQKEMRRQVQLAAAQQAVASAGAVAEHKATQTATPGVLPATAA